MPDHSPFLLRHQGPMLRVLGRIALGALRRKKTDPYAPEAEVPGPVVQRTLPPRSDTLLDAYAAWAGAEPGQYRDEVPPHFFPQWSLPLSTETVASLPFPLARILNQGCDVEVLSPLLRRTPLSASARLSTLEERNGAIRLAQRVDTTTSSDEEGIRTTLHGVVPIQRPQAKKRKARKRRQPLGFDEVGRWEASLSDARAFCWLTGDLNPIHWVGPAARRAGFPRPILHGFGILARTWEVLADLGEDRRLRALSVKFFRPVVLPASVHVLVAEPNDEGDHAIRLLDASGQSCLAGSVRFTT